MPPGEKLGEGFVEARLDTTKLRGDTARAGRNIQQSLQQTGKQLRQTGGMMTRRLTMPIVAAGAAIVKVATDFETSMKQVEAVTGATGKELQGLEDLAKRLGRTTQFSASQAAEGMYFLASAGFETNEVMEAMPGVLSLAAAANMDLARATDIASNILSGYGMEASELGRVNDVLVATFQNTNTNVEQLGEAMKYVGPVAKGAGVEFEQVAAAAGLLGNAGIQASQAGTSLRGAISKLLNPSSAAASVLDELGIQAANADGTLRPLDEIVNQLADSGATTGQMMEIFGQRAGPAMAALVEQGGDALNDLTAELKESGGIAEEVADKQMEGMRGSMLRLKSAAEGAAIAIADTGLLEGLANFAENVAGAFQSLAEANPALLKFGAIVAAGVAAAGPVMWAVGAAISALGVLLSPAGLVIGGLVALGAALINLVGEGDNFAEKFMDAIGKVRDFIGPAVEGIGDAISGIGEFFGITRKTVGEEVAEMSNEAVGEVVDMVSDMTDEIHRLAMDGESMSEEMADKFIANVERMRDDSIAAAEEQFEEQRQTYLDLADELDTLTGDMAADALANAREQRDETVAAAEDQADRVLRHLEGLKESGVEVTEAMRDNIVATMEDQRDSAIHALTVQEEEAVNALSRLEAEAGQITVDMAAEVISNSAEQRDKSVAAAQQQYEETVAAINQMARENEDITEEQRKAMIREARVQRDGSVSDAEKQHREVVDEVKGMREGVEGEVDLMSGNVLSSWDKFYRDHLEGLQDWTAEMLGHMNSGLDSAAGSVGVWVEETAADLWNWNEDAGNAILDWVGKVPGWLGSMWGPIQRGAARGVNGFIGILNGMIRGVNRVANAVGMGDLLSEIGTVSWGETRSPGRMHSGGIVGRDEQGGPDRLLPGERLQILQSGEEVLTADDPRHRVNLGSEDDEIGNPLARAGRAIADMAHSAIAKARGVAADVLDAGIPQVPDLSSTFGPAGKIATASGQRVREGVLDWIRGVDEELSANELGPGVGWQAMWDALSDQFPWARLTSSYRPGAITATGNPSFHGMGRAIDVAGRGYMNHDDMLAIARWVAEQHGAKTAELIYSRGPSLIDGRSWIPTGVTRADHYDHVHWAMGDGAVVNQPTLGLLGEKAGATPEIVTPQRLMADTFRDVLSTTSSLDGTRLKLVVGGREFDAYMEVVADDVASSHRRAQARQATVRRGGR